MDLRRVDVRNGELHLAWRTKLKKDPHENVTVIIDYDDMLLEIETMQLTAGSPIEDALADLGPGEGTGDGHGYMLVIALQNGSAVFDVDNKMSFVWEKSRLLETAYPTNEPKTLGDFGIWGGTLVWRVPKMSRLEDAMKAWETTYRCGPGNDNYCTRAMGCQCAFDQVGWRNIWPTAFTPTRETALWLDASDSPLDQRFIRTPGANASQAIIGCCTRGECMSFVMSNAYLGVVVSPLVEALKTFPADDVDPVALVNGDYSVLCPVVVDPDGNPVDTIFTLDTGLLLSTEHRRALVVLEGDDGAKESVVRIALLPIEGSDRRQVDVASWQILRAGESAMQPFHPGFHSTTGLMGPGKAWYVYSTSAERNAIKGIEVVEEDVGSKRKRSAAASTRSISATGKGKGKGKGKQPRTRDESAAAAAARRFIRRKDVKAPSDEYGDFALEHILRQGSWDELVGGDVGMDGWTRSRVVLPDFTVLANSRQRVDGVRPHPDDIAPFMRTDEEVSYGGALKIGGETLLAMATRAWKKVCSLSARTYAARIKTSTIGGQPVLKIWPTKTCCLYVFTIGDTKRPDLDPSQVGMLKEVRCILSYVESNGKMVVRDITEGIIDSKCHLLANPKILWEIGVWQQRRFLPESLAPLFKYVGKRSLNADGYMYGGEQEKKSPGVKKGKARGKGIRVARAIITSEDDVRRSSRTAAKVKTEADLLSRVRDLMKPFDDIDFDAIPRHTKPLVALAETIMNHPLTGGGVKSFVLQLATMVFWQLPKAVQDGVRSGDVRMPKDISSVIDRLVALASALNLKTLLAPALDTNSEEEMWRTLARSASSPLELAVDINVSVSGALYVRNVMDTLFLRLRISSSDLAEQRAMDPNTTRGRYSRMLAPFTDLAHWFAETADLDTLVEARDAALLPVYAVGRMGQGKSTLWNWWAYVCLKTYEVAMDDDDGSGDLHGALALVQRLYKTHRTVDLETVLAKGAEARMQKIAAAHAGLANDIGSMQAFINNATGLGTGKGVTSTTRVLTVYKPGTRGTVNLVYQEDGVVSSVRGYIRHDDNIDLLCATIAELLRIINAGDPKSVLNKITRVEVEGPFPFTVVDTPGIGDANLRVDTLLRSELENPFNKEAQRIFHVSQIDQTIKAMLESSGRNATIVCPANVARSGEMHDPLFYARSKTYVEMARDQAKDHMPARHAIRGDGFVSLWGSVMRHAKLGGGYEGLPEEARASQVAEILDAVLRPVVEASGRVKAWIDAKDDMYEAYDRGVTGSDQEWRQAVKAIHSAARTIVAGSLDLTEPANPTIRTIITSMVQDVAALYRGAKTSHSAHHADTLRQWSKAQELLLRHRNPGADYEVCVLNVVEDYTTRATKELFPDWCINTAMAALETVVNGVSELGKDPSMEAALVSLCKAIIARAFGTDPGVFPGVADVREAMRGRLERALALIGLDALKSYLDDEDEDSFDMLEKIVRPSLWNAMQMAGSEILWYIRNGIMQTPSEGLVRAADVLVKKVLANEKDAKAAMKAARLMQTRTVLSIVNTIVGFGNAINPKIDGLVSPLLEFTTAPEADTKERPMDPAALGEPLMDISEDEDKTRLCVDTLASMLVRGTDNGGAPSHGAMLLATAHAIMPPTLRKTLSTQYPSFRAMCDLGEEESFDGATSAYDHYIKANSAASRIHADLSVIAMVSGIQIELETSTGVWSFPRTYLGYLVRASAKDDGSWRMRFRLVGDRVLMVV